MVRGFLWGHVSHVYKTDLTYLRIYTVCIHTMFALHRRNALRNRIVSFVSIAPLPASYH